ncbi:DUF2860 domain-containing protein [Vibrio vulnificus]|uniref:DUF2860 domain-containing protein n=1 Tax=Vibrio vulnificus TaxID=672 RepID=UPI0009322445|nr:DUF2860 domain-containing protein [Vibrio vulnificus]EHT4942723.1 DUF2860 domain-containing protein [Vibrio vulnificus]POB06620.1 DUF2860 domain-containing protein [Vibrio vulnificus]
MAQGSAMKNRILITTALIFSHMAQAGLSDTAGFSGEISLLTGYGASQSHFNTETDATISNYSSSASREGAALFAPLGNIAYTFGQQLEQQFYLGTAREDIAVGTLAFELGYQYQLSSGVVIDFSLLPTVMSGETWQDPYLLNQKRTVTDESGIAYRLQFHNLWGGNVNLDTAYGTKELEKDTITDPSLKRDGESYYAKLDYRYRLKPTSFVQPAVVYLKHQADGKAASYDSLGAEVSWFNLFAKHRLVLTAGYKVQDYQAASQLFDKKREDQQLSLFLAYEYAQLFSSPDWSFVALAGYNQTDSNIEFYKQSDYLLSVGVNYKF